MVPSIGNKYIVPKNTGGKMGRFKKVHRRIAVHFVRMDVSADFISQNEEKLASPERGGGRRSRSEGSFCEIFCTMFDIYRDPSVSAAHCQLPFQGSLKIVLRLCNIELMNTACRVRRSHPSAIFTHKKPRRIGRRLPIRRGNG